MADESASMLAMVREMITEDGRPIVLLGRRPPADEDKPWRGNPQMSPLSDTVAVFIEQEDDGAAVLQGRRRCIFLVPEGTSHRDFHEIEDSLDSTRWKIESANVYADGGTVLAVEARLYR